MRTADYGMMEAEYVAGGCSYQSIAEKYNVSRSLIAKIGRKEEWQKKREEYKNKVRDMALEESAKQDAEAIEKLKCTADRVAGIFADIANDEKQFCRYIIQEKEDGNAVSKERIFGKQDTKSLRDMTAALKDLVFVMRDLHDSPNLQDRLENESIRKKLSEDTESSCDDEKHGVIFLPEAGNEAGN